MKITFSRLIKSKKVEVEQEKFKKLRKYAVTGLSFNQNVGSNLAVVTDTEKKDTISKLTQKLVKEKKDPDLDLRVYNEQAFERIIPFTKKT